jgi:hypothetical protein
MNLNGCTAATGNYSQHECCMLVSLQGLALFRGGVLMVSHDQHLIESTVDELWAVEQGTGAVQAGIPGAACSLSSQAPVPQSGCNRWSGYHGAGENLLVQCICEVPARCGLNLQCCMPRGVNCAAPCSVPTDCLIPCHDCTLQLRHSTGHLRSTRPGSGRNLRARRGRRACREACSGLVNAHRAM